MIMCKTELGIDTFSFYSNLTPKQKSGILEVLRALPGFQTKREDYIEETYEYTSDCFADQGVKLMVFRKKKSVWGLFVVLHPTLLLGEDDRSALYHPKKKVQGTDETGGQHIEAGPRSMQIARDEAVPGGCHGKSVF